MQSGRVRVAVLVVVLAVTMAALLSLPTVQTAQAEGKVGALVGKNVHIKLASSAYRGGQAVVGLDGKVTSADEHGLWINAAERSLQSGNGQYSGQLYIPWTNVAYVKIMK